MTADFPSRVPLLWLLAPFVLGIISGRLFPAEIHPSVYLVAIALALVATATRRLALWAPMLLTATALAGYVYIVQLDKGFPNSSEYPEREATLTLEISRLYESTHSKARGIVRVTATDSHLNHIKNRETYFSVAAAKGRQFEDILTIGSIVAAKGVLSPLDTSDGESGFSSYLRNSGVATLFTRATAISVDKPRGSWNQRFQKLRSRANQALMLGFSGPELESGPYRAMMLGMRSELEPEQEALFLENGAMHLFAISGLHIGVIAACGHYLFLLIRIPKRWIPLANIGLILLFVMMTGGAPSAWRALLMIACCYLCLSSKRQAASLNALVLSALICLVIDPLQLFLAGFQLSYATVAAILLYGIPMGDRLCKKWRPVDGLPRDLWTPLRVAFHKFGRFLISSLAISFAAFLASSAFSIIYFNTVPIFGVIANVIMLPLASLTIISGFLSLAFATLSLSPISILFNHAAHAIIWTMQNCLKTIAQLGYTHISFSDPSIALLFGLSLGLLVFLFHGYNRSWQFKARWQTLFPLSYGALCLVAGWL